MRTKILGGLILGLLAGPVAAAAAPISGSFSFTASGFGAGAPYDPVTGWVEYSFDNSAEFFNAADGATINGVTVQVSVSGLSLPGSWVPVLTYLNRLGVQDVLAIGHGPTTVVSAGTDDWRVAVNSISGRPTFREFAYATSSTSSVFLTNTGSVPEPGTLALVGLGVLGLVLNRRR